ncbi:hypothetical protein [Streptomyces prasinopilosus]|uniref:hypothetical protein n=1 Tax=Streptomyces prasinopilosus TaxID=67344 RepID=UPI0006EB2826|nr:hypothetical protein [Streptomyces prasinopilosus]
MSEPVRWVIPALLVVSVLGVVLAVWWERRRPLAYTRSREYLARREEWRSMPAVVQAAHDEAVLDAQEAAAARAGESSVVRTAELIVAAEWARSITEK